MIRIVEFARDDDGLRRAAAELLVAEFREHWPHAWPTLAAAEAEVGVALADERIAFAAYAGTDELAGWCGALPMYDGNVWELHPLVVRRTRQRRGIGRALVQRLEEETAARGAFTLWVGTDDEAALTSVGGIDLYPGVLDRLRTLESRRGHPYEFYRRLGFELAGIVPDANGFGKPDLLLAKRVRASD